MRLFAERVKPLVGLRWSVAVFVLAGCPNQELAPLEPCTVSGVSLDAAGNGVDKVDLLFMIDNSGSMAEKQKKLGEKLSQLVGVITSGNKDYPNPPASDDRKFTPAKSLHVGVVTQDLGSPPGTQRIPSPTCAINNGGPHGNGLLQYTGEIAATDQIDQNTKQKVKDAVPACAQVSLSPPYLDFGNGMDEPHSVDVSNAAALQNGIFQFGCIATLGTNGCGIEQQLESAWKALAPAGVNDFYGPDTAGQGSRANNGFLRSDSVLSVVLVSDEDDCSVTPQGSLMFEQSAAAGIPPVQVRCQLLKDDPAYSGLMRPISRYVDGFIGLRASFPERFIFAGIVGLPQGADVPYDDPTALLNHPQMVVALNPSTSGSNVDINTACGSATSPDGTGYPGRRYVEFAKAIKDGAKGSSFVLRSICDTDFTPALNLLIEKIASQLKGACLPRPLQRDPSTGLITCGIVEILAQDANGKDIGTCSYPGRSPAAGGTRDVDGKTRTACQVVQLKAGAESTDPGGAGWYYDDSSAALEKVCPNGQRVAFTAQADLQSGALARVECFQPQPRVTENTRGYAAINTSCADDSNLCTTISLPNEVMLCESVSKTCQIACDTSANCPEGFLCAGEQKFCQNPTCSISGS